MNPQQYRNVIALLLLILAGLVWQIRSLDARLDRLQSDLDEVYYTAHDGLEAAKDAAGRPSLRLTGVEDR